MAAHPLRATGEATRAPRAGADQAPLAAGPAMSPCRRLVFASSLHCRDLIAQGGTAGIMLSAAQTANHRAETPGSRAARMYGRSLGPTAGSGGSRHSSAESQRPHPVSNSRTTEPRRRVFVAWQAAAGDAARAIGVAGPAACRLPPAEVILRAACQIRAFSREAASALWTLSMLHCAPTHEASGTKIASARKPPWSA
jgi:hypothetical protein